MAELNWRKGPAQGVGVEVECGDRFLVAVPVCTGRPGLSRKYWEYYGVEATEDGFRFDCEWDLAWEYVEWYVPVEELTPGPLPKFVGEGEGDVRGS